MTNISFFTDILLHRIFVLESIIGILFILVLSLSAKIIIDANKKNKIEKHK